MVDIKNIISLTEELQQKYTQFLDEEHGNINGELRVKMGIAESKLFKIARLLRENYPDES